MLADTAAGARLGPPSPAPRRSFFVIAAVAQLLQLTCEELGLDADLTAIVQPVEKRAGVKVRAPGP